VSVKGLLAQTLPSHPNILFIYLDDMDYMDSASYGGTDSITPNIESIANEGMVFTQHYSLGPICSPSRAAVLTSQFPSTFGFNRAIAETSVAHVAGWQRDRRGIPKEFATLPELLQANGYTTGHFGKWHVGLYRDEYKPTAKGYTRTVRTKGDGPNDYVDYKVSINEGNYFKPATLYREDYLTNEALTFINDHADEPFFVNLWYMLPHTPLHVPPDFDNSCCGFVLITDRGKLLSMMYKADTLIGTLLAKLDDLGIADNTIVIVTSDNGGMRDATKRPERIASMKGYKQQMFEGALKTPFMVRWPGNIDPGSINHSLISGLDILPTIAEVAGVDLSQLQYTPKGSSMVDLWLNNTVRFSYPDLFWENKRGATKQDNETLRFAVRSGNWKLVQQPDNGALRLYDVANDPTETTNLAGQNPDIVDALLAKYHAWRRQTGDIALSAPILSGGVLQYGDTFEFDNVGKVTFPFNPRTDFHNGDFTIATRVRVDAFPQYIDRPYQYIARKRHSWLMRTQKNHTMQVAFFGKDFNGNRKTVRLNSPVLLEGQTYDVMVSVIGYKTDYQTFNLYVDGLLVDQKSSPDTIVAVETSDFSIELGNITTLHEPFDGAIDLPLVSVESLVPQEIYSGVP
jgi:arylsulfatase A-like enzyme